MFDLENKKIHKLIFTEYSKFFFPHQTVIDSKEKVRASTFL